MASVNSMLIPDVESLDQGFRARVIDENGDVLWSSPIEVRAALQAWQNAVAAVESICVERRRRVRLI